ncbi:MAG TPA: DUF4388 domain-containing protein [Pyrinomonadaceae bacterium]
MAGLLCDHPLAELIHELSGGHLSGVLRVSRERAKGAVYFDEGRVVGALTNLRAYRLTESLRRNGAVGAAKLDALLRPEMPDDAAGAALVAAGLLAPDELRRLRERLASEVLRQLLQWEDGEWSFDARVRLDEGQHVRVEVGGLLVESARRLSPAFAAKSFRDAGERLSLADATALTGGDANGGPQLQPSEGFVLSRFDAPLSLDELVAVSGLPDEETRKAVYVLVLGGLLSRERPPRALPAAAAVAATTPRKTPPAAERPNATTATAETTKPEEEAKPPAAEEATTEAAIAPKDPKDELAELFERAEAGSHYEVLGVGQLSKPDEIKRAYYALARRFHPDRFRQTVAEDERQRVELAFAKIAQAYDLLKDSAQRAAYDLKLSASRAPAPTADPAPPERKTETAQPRESDHAPRPDATADAPPAPPGKAGADLLRRAEELFQAGQAALGQQNYAAATKCLGEAVLLVPQQARYRAFFGRLLARDRTTRRQAEAELQAAISLDARNVSYRLMLAELYRDVGLRRRAEAELEQALSIDRTSDAARRLLEELRKGG